MYDNDEFPMKYKWVSELHPQGDGVFIHEYLNGILQETRHAADEVIKTTLIAYLRMNGYVVIEPTELDGSREVLGE